MHRGGAEIVLALEQLTGQLSPQCVITVGRFVPHPGAVNVIAGSAELSIDFRDPSNELLGASEARIETLVRDIAARRKLTVEVELLESLPVVAMDASVCERLIAAAAKVGVPNIPQTISGALHDSAILAPVIPTAMLFVASRDGISHNPAEFSRIEDFELAARILAAAVS